MVCQVNVSGCNDEERLGHIIVKFWIWIRYLLKKIKIKIKLLGDPTTYVKSGGTNKLYK